MDKAVSVLQQWRIEGLNSDVTPKFPASAGLDIVSGRLTGE
jgi:hypothetical protein